MFFFPITKLKRLLYNSSNIARMGKRLNFMAEAARKVRLYFICMSRAKK